MPRDGTPNTSPAERGDTVKRKPRAVQGDKRHRHDSAKRNLASSGPQSINLAFNPATSRWANSAGTQQGQPCSQVTPTTPGTQPSPTTTPQQQQHLYNPQNSTSVPHNNGRLASPALTNASRVIRPGPLTTNGLVTGIAPLPGTPHLLTPAQLLNGNLYPGLQLRQRAPYPYLRYPQFFPSLPAQPLQVRPTDI